MSRPIIDDLKQARDGHLGYGPKWEPPRPKPGTMLWSIERDEDGLPVRMAWMGRVPDAEEPGP